MEDSLEGQELLLTSGIALAGDQALQSEIFNIMKRKRCAGIIVAIGQYMPSIPAEMQAQADSMQIPLLTVPWEVNFIDIIRVLLTQLVQSHYRYMELSQRLNQELLGVILRGGDMTDICVCIEDVLQTRVTVCDDSFRTLATGVTGTNGLLDEWQLSKSLAARLLCSDDQCAAKMLHLENDVTGVAAPISVGRRRRGFILFEPRELDPGVDLKLGELAGTIASLIMTREEELLKATKQAEGRIIGMLDGTISARASSLLDLGLKPGEPVWVIIAEFDLDDPVLALSQAKSYLRGHAGATALAVRGRSLVGLVQKPRDKQPTWAEKLDKHLRGQGFAPRLGVSGPIDDPSNISARYQDIREVLQFKDLLQPSANVIKVENCGTILRVMRHLVAGSDARDLCPAIIKIQEHDRSQHGSLIEALACLLEVDGNISLAARQLGIHRHTILYRLNRISEILGTELDSSMRFELRLQLLAWAFVGARDQR